MDIDVVVDDPERISLRDETRYLAGYLPIGQGLLLEWRQGIGSCRFCKTNGRQLSEYRRKFCICYSRRHRRPDCVRHECRLGHDVRSIRCRISAPIDQSVQTNRGHAQLHKGCALVPDGLTLRLYEIVSLYNGAPGVGAPGSV